jgi:hypothetical protein
VCGGGGERNQNRLKAVEHQGHKLMTGAAKGVCVWGGERNQNRLKAVEHQGHQLMPGGGGKITRPKAGAAASGFRESHERWFST